VQSPRDAIGAIVRVTTPGGSWLRQWKGGGSYASTNTRRLHFGLGAATTIDAIDIRWPSGARQILKAVAADQRMRVIEAADPIAH
jgi:hypothetical protein